MTPLAASDPPAATPPVARRLLLVAGAAVAGLHALPVVAQTAAPAPAVALDFESAIAGRTIS